MTQRTFSRLLLAVAAIAVFTLILTPTAVADPLFSGTATYNSGTFSIVVTQTGTNTYLIKYTADFNGWTGLNKYIAGVDFKFGSDPILSATLVSSTANGTWTLHAPSGSLTGGAIGINGCQSNTGSTFVCADTKDITSPTTGTYEWVFEITYANPLTSSDFTFDNSHIGALFVNLNGSSRGILSSGITAVPEPNSLALLVTGFMALGLRRFARK